MPSTNKQTYANWQNNTAANWWQDKGLRKSMASIFILYLCVFTFGYDGALLGGLQTMPKWQAYFNMPTGNRLGLISASFYFPKIVTPFIAAWLSERFGRRVPLLIGSVLSIIGGLLGAFANGDGMFIGGRVLLGGGLAFQAIIAPPLLAELCHPRLRAVTAASYYCTYYIGSTVASWACFGFLAVDSDWGWRVATLLQITGTGIVGLWIICGLMPESPRWLVSKGREAQALGILASMHSNGDTEDELVQHEFEEIKSGIARDIEASKHGYRAFFETPGNRRRFIVVAGIGAATQLVGNGLVSYYLAPILRLLGITNPAQQGGINAGLAMFNLLAAAIGAQFVERWGRRPLWLTGAVGMFFSFVVVTGLSAGFANSRQAAMGTAVIPFLYVFYGFYDICLTILPTLYIPEILPFHLRSKGMAVYGFFQAVSVSFNQWVNPVALAAITWKYYCVYLAVQLAFIAFVWLLVKETKGMTIEEVSRIFDGPNTGDATSSDVHDGSSKLESENLEPDVIDHSYTKRA